MRDDDPMSVEQPTWRIQLFGDPAVWLGVGQIVALERRAAALVALAALEPGISRLRAAALLWPDSQDPRRNLRQQMLRFRQLFGRDLLVGVDTLQVATSWALDVDGDEAHGGGPLLGSHDYADCEAFAAWLAQQRQSQRDRLLEAARQRVADSEAAGKLDEALTAAKALLAIDAQLESHHRELMRLHYLRGDTAAGLAAYRRLGEMLALHFDTRPSAESDELADLLRASARPDAGRKLQRQGLPVSLRRPPRLVGREREHSAALHHWSEGRAVLLEGEAGLGKSRLMAELLAGRMATVQAAGRPGDAGTPYATLARLLRPLLDDGVADLDPAMRQTLAQVFALGDPGASGEAGGSTPASAALRPGALASAVSALWLQRGVQGIALDDLHFADEASIELVAGLVASNTPPRRWLFAGRSAELPAAAQALRSSLTELRRLGVVALAALDERAVGTIVDALAIEGLHGSDLAEPLWRHTGGNPLFVLETLKHGLSDGSLARGELPRPLSVTGLIEGRLQRLSEPALTLARVAAIAGVDFSIELAEAVIGVRAVQLASAWGELQETQVLRDESFAHDLVADAALRSVPPVVARRVHGQCAQWLAIRGVEPARVAWHWRLGGVPAEAGRAFVAAALRAEQAARLQEEAALYEHAALAFADAGMDDERFDALIGRVRSLNGAEFDDMAMQACHALIAASRNDTQRVRAHSELCGLLTERGEPLAALAAGDAAMALARRLADPEWQVRTACHMATALCRLGRSEEAVALLAPLRAWVDAQADDTLRMLWHGEWGASLGHAGRLCEAVGAYDTALAASRRLGLRDAEGRLLLNRSVTLRQSGQIDQALACSRDGQALSVAGAADPAERPVDRLVLARDEAEAGLYGPALRALERVLAEFERRGTAFWAQACRMVLVRLWLDLGQFARAVPLLRDEADDLPAWLRADRHLLQLDLARALGQPAAAGTLEQALSLAVTDAQRGPSLQVRALRSLPPFEVAAQVESLARLLAAKERHGALLALRVHAARAALEEGRAEAAAAAARSALLLFEQGVAPESMYRAEAYLVAWQALTRAGASTEASVALQAGAHWIRSRALPHVPAPFLDSFLHRNAVNRTLLEAAGSCE